VPLFSYLKLKSDTLRSPFALNANLRRYATGTTPRCWRTARPAGAWHTSRIDTLTHPPSYTRHSPLSPQLPLTTTSVPPQYPLSYPFSVPPLFHSLHYHPSLLEVKATLLIFRAFCARALELGSGKTYTMGSGNSAALLEEEIGIIPRVIQDIFAGIDKRKGLSEITVRCVFLEVGPCKLTPGCPGLTPG
jgi:hypothetical protein